MVLFTQLATTPCFFTLNNIMARLIDRILFPDEFGQHFLFDENEIDIFERRVYRILNRRKINEWDDIEFKQRFRFTKPFFLRLLAMAGPLLAHNRFR